MAVESAFLLSLASFPSSLHENKSTEAASRQLNFIDMLIIFVVSDINENFGPDNDPDVPIYLIPD